MGENREMGVKKRVRDCFGGLSKLKRSVEASNGEGQRMAVGRQVDVLSGGEGEIVCYRCRG